jgi:hypothetical protein
MDHTSTSLPQASRPALAVRLRRLSTGVRLLVAAGALMSVALPLVLAVGPQSLLRAWMGPNGDNLAHLLVGDFTAAVRGRLILALLPSLGVSLGLLWQLWQLFGHYRKGNVFGSDALAHLRRFGWLMVVLAALGPISRMLMSVAISLGNPPGQRQLVLTLDSNDYVLLLLSLVFVAIARVMGEAVRLAEENEQFV